MAFCHPIVQKVLSDLENDLFRREIQAVNSEHEVFVTGLPRAGTTLLLELLYATKEFGTYTYRNMPFVLSPLIWSRLSKSFRKTGEIAERAHGDGVEISYDSPEAFEEIVWLTHMANVLVQPQWLAECSSADVTDDLIEALRYSARKVVLLEAADADKAKPLRYLSKNNANVSRLSALRKIFPTSQVLVLFRHPLAQISSLEKQHARFLALHKEDKFSKQYMKWIGHFEFGENFRPINFAGWLNDSALTTQVDKSFWLKYWTVAYSRVLEQESSDVLLLDFDRLLENKAASLEKLADVLGLEHKDRLVAGAESLRKPTTRPADIETCSPREWEAAEDVYAQLQSRAI